MSDSQAQTPVAGSSDGYPPVVSPSGQESSNTNRPPVTSNDPVTSDTPITTPTTTPPTTPPTSPTTPITHPPSDTTSSTPPIITSNSNTHSDNPPPSSRPPSSRPPPSSTWTSIPTPVVIVTSSGTSIYTFTSTSYSSKTILMPTLAADEPTNQVNAGAIAGGVVGGVAGLAIIGLGAFFFLKRRTRKRQHHLSYSTNGGNGFGSVADGLENTSHHPDDFYGTTVAASSSGGGYSEMGDSASKARPFVAPYVGHPSSEDGYYSPSQRPQQQEYYQDHDFYATPYQYVANHPMQYPQQNQSGSTQPTERHIPHLVQEPSHSIDVPHSKDE